MKVIEKNKDKDGKVVSIKFNPSEKMLNFLESLVRLGSYKSIAEVCRQADVDESTYFKWKYRYGTYFTDWLFTEYEKYRNEIVLYLDQIGLAKAKNDFSFWEAMQKKYGGLESAPKGGSIFNVINNNNAGRSKDDGLSESEQRIQTEASDRLSKLFAK